MGTSKWRMDTSNSDNATDEVKNHAQGLVCDLCPLKKELLTHSGKVSAEVAKKKANLEYDKFHQRSMYELTPVELHFIENFEREQKLLKDK